MLPSLLFAQTRLDTHTPSYMRPAGAPANGEAVLGWWLIGTAIAVTVIITVLVVWAVLRNRDPRTDRLTDAATDTPRGRWQVVSGVAWIYVGGAITVVILLVAFGGTLASLARASRLPDRAPITLDVTAHQWWWEVQVGDSVAGDAFVTANEVHVPVGVPIRVRVQTADVIHSFWVPELGGKMDVIPGQMNETWLRADRPGIYRGACAEYCGMQHAHMAFTVVAESPARYAAWAAAQRADAQQPTVMPATAGAIPVGAAATGAPGVPTTPAGPAATQPPPDASPEVVRGQRVFVASCGACHAVRGTDAGGRFGPDLTHVASRLTIAAGLLDNTRPNLLRWVRDAQSQKAGVLMPRMDLPAGDVAAVVSYLQTLR